MQNCMHAVEALRGKQGSAARGHPHVQSLRLVLPAGRLAKEEKSNTRKEKRGRAATATASEVIVTSGQVRRGRCQYNQVQSVWVRSVNNKEAQAGREIRRLFGYYFD